MREYSAHFPQIVRLSYSTSILFMTSEQHSLSKSKDYRLTLYIRHYKCYTACSIREVYYVNKG